MPHEEIDRRRRQLLLRVTVEITARVVREHRVEQPLCRVTPIGGPPLEGLADLLAGDILERLRGSMRTPTAA